MLETVLDTRPVLRTLSRGELCSVNTFVTSPGQPLLIGGLERSSLTSHYERREEQRPSWESPLSHRFTSVKKCWHTSTRDDTLSLSPGRHWGAVLKINTQQKVNYISQAGSWKSILWQRRMWPCATAGLIRVYWWILDQSFHTSAGLPGSIIPLRNGQTSLFQHLRRRKLRDAHREAALPAAGGSHVSVGLLPSVMQKTLRKASSWAEMGGSLQCSAKTQDLEGKQTNILSSKKHVSNFKPLEHRCFILVQTEFSPEVLWLNLFG